MTGKLFCGQFLTGPDLNSAGFKSLGENVQIHEHANIVFAENITIGNNVRIDAYVNIVASGPMVIGSHVHIGACCHLDGGAGIIMEDFSGMSQGAKIYSKSDDYSGDFLTGPTVPREFIGEKRGKVVLRRHVVIGSSSVVLPGVEIGEGSIVGAMSLVNRSLPAWGMYVGIPAKFLKPRSKKILALEERLAQL